MTPISLMNGNVGPDLRTDRKGVEKDGPPYTTQGFSELSHRAGAHRTLVSSLSIQWLAAPLGSQDSASMPSTTEAPRTEGRLCEVCP